MLAEPGADLFPHQRPPRKDDWRCWLVLGGRGSGKTRAGAEWVQAGVDRGEMGRVALVAPTLEAARDVMIEGPSGLREIAPSWNRPRFHRARRRLEWPNGARADCYSGAAPDGLRGPQHHAAWGDEFCAWTHVEETLANLRMGLRLGAAPRLMLTTTPRPLPALKRLMSEDGVKVKRAKTREATFLPEAFRSAMAAAYAGTARGAQELDGEIVEDRVGALWTHALIGAARGRVPERLDRVVVAVDPPVSTGAKADGCGIVVAGAAGEGAARRAYVLADASLQGARPSGWARAVAAAYEVWAADRVVAEINQGGELVAGVLRQAAPGLPVTCVRATRGKTVRAEPVAALYEQGRVVHCGVFEALETEMRLLGSGLAADDRADALVWALTALMLEGGEPRVGW